MERYGCPLNGDGTINVQNALSDHDCALINQLAIGDWYDNGLWTAYPATYEEEADLGLTADGLDVGALHDGQWFALQAEFDDWRNRQLADDAENIREVVGSTVAVSAKTRGLEWTDRECYFRRHRRPKILVSTCR